jgi:hypothetical protein
MAVSDDEEIDYRTTTNAKSQESTKKHRKIFPPTSSVIIDIDDDPCGSGQATASNSVLPTAPVPKIHTSSLLPPLSNATTDRLYSNDAPQAPISPSLIDKDTEPAKTLSLSPMTQTSIPIAPTPIAPVVPIAPIAPIVPIAPIAPIAPIVPITPVAPSPVSSVTTPIAPVRVVPLNSSHQAIGLSEDITEYNNSQPDDGVAAPVPPQPRVRLRLLFICSADDSELPIISRLLRYILCTVNFLYSESSQLLTILLCDICVILQQRNFNSETFYRGSSRRLRRSRPHDLRQGPQGRGHKRKEINIQQNFRTIGNIIHGSVHLLVTYLFKIC